jgi:hypothetical protein
MLPVLNLESAPDEGEMAGVNETLGASRKAATRV